MSTQPVKRIPALDGLRGIAILLVILYHTTGFQNENLFTQVWLPMRSIMWCGVDLFFVLSGFLITRILIESKASQHYFRNFYARRTLRVFPLYYGVLAVLFIGLPLLGVLGVSEKLSQLLHSESYTTLQSRQWWLWAYLQNFYQARGPSQLPSAGHLWSLAIEEQFYLVWPAVVWFCAPNRLAKLCVAICVSVFLLRIGLVMEGTSGWAIFHWTFTRADSLAFGALAAAVLFLPNAKQAILSQARWVMGGCVVGLVACGFYSGSLEKTVPTTQMFVYTLFAILAATLVLLIAEAKLPKTFAKLLESPVLCSLGKFSYAMYIFHWPLCRLFKTTSSWALFPIVFAASFMLAWLSWHLYEKHFLKLKRFF